MLRISSRAEVTQMIGGGWQVLDVGSGDRPFPRATTLVDRLPHTHESPGGVHRENPTAAIVRHGLPFIVGELEALPLADQSFDFAYAAHVIEHVADLPRALGELERVAPRGYIECPRAWYEFVDTSPFHHWLIDFVEGELQFRAKSEVERKFAESRRLFDADAALFARFYGQVFEANDPGGASIERSVCHLCLYWEDKIPCRRMPSPTYTREAGSDASGQGK